MPTSYPLHTAEIGCSLSGAVVTLSGVEAAGMMSFAAASAAAGADLADGGTVQALIYDPATPAWALWQAAYDETSGTLTRVIEHQSAGTLGATGLTVAAAAWRDLSRPGPIGETDPSTGKFTTIRVGTSTTISAGTIAGDGTYQGSGQLNITGASEVAKRMRIGYDTTNDLGFLQPVHAGVGYSSLALCPLGGNLSVGTLPATHWSATYLSMNLGPHGFVYNNRGTGSDGGFGKGLYYDGAWRYSSNITGVVTAANSGGDFGVYTAPSGTAGAVATLVQGLLATNTGYVKLGADAAAPAIRQRKLTGTTAATEGGSVNIAHGVASPEKIIGLDVLVNPTPNVLVRQAHSVGSNGYEFSAAIIGADLNVTNATGNSSNILSKPFTALITYEE